MHSTLETTILGSIMFSEKAWHQVSDILREEFFSGRNQIIFACIKSMYESGLPVDPVTVADEFVKRGQSGVVDNGAYIIEIANRHISSANIKALSVSLREKYLEVDLRKAVLDGVREANNGREIVELLQRLVKDAEAGFVGADDGPSPIEEVIKKWIGEIESSEGSGNVRIDSGISDLDRVVGPILDGDLVVIAGRPGMGKSSLAKIWSNNAAEKGLHVVEFSLEMTGSQLLSLNVGQMSGAADPLRAARLGETIDESNWPLITQSLEKISKNKIWIDDTPAIDISELEARALTLNRRNRIDLIIVDYIQLVTSRDKKTRIDVVSDVSQRLKALAKKIKCPVIALSQLNRALEARTNKRPVMSDLRDSGQIEQDADIILFVYRDGFYKDPPESSGVAEIICGKHRFKELGKAYTYFAGNKRLFLDLDHYERSEYINSLSKKKGSAVKGPYKTSGV